MPFYVESNGFLTLDADGAVATDTLNEFRDNNRELMRLIGAKTIDDAKAKLTRLKDIDPDKFSELQEQLKKYEDGKAPKLEELITTRTEAMRKDYEKKIAERDEAITSQTKRLSKLMIDDALAEAAAKKGVLPSALEDVKLRGRQVFKLEGDEVIATAVDGKPIYGKDSKPLRVDEYMERLATEAAHLFKPNSGSGSGGSGGGGGYDKPNPFSRKSLNLTEQGRLQRDNPQLAAALRQQAEKE